MRPAVINRFTCSLRICDSPCAMVAIPFLPRRRRLATLATIFVAVAAVCLLASEAGAQQPQVQEPGLLDRLEHPDRTLHYSPADKEFSVSSNGTDKKAAVGSFAFSHPATLRVGDGAFHPSAFSGADSFRTRDFSTRAAFDTTRAFTQTDKQFGTKGFDVREDRAANKSVAIRGYVPAEKPFLGRGRRQDSIDELRKQKNLSIDQVREILNKNK